MSETRIVALIIGSLPDRLDPTICGEEIVLAKRLMKSAAAARRWIDTVLATSLPDGLMYRFGSMRKEQWSDEDYGWWEVIAESDTITADERDRPTQWFPA